MPQIPGNRDSVPTGKKLPDSTYPRAMVRSFGLDELERQVSLLVLGVVRSAVVVDLVGTDTVDLPAVDGPFELQRLAVVGVARQHVDALGSQFVEPIGKGFM